MYFPSLGFAVIKVCPMPCICCKWIDFIFHRCLPKSTAGNLFEMQLLRSHPGHTDPDREILGGIQPYMS